jgi:hypothetical protein
MIDLLGTIRCNGDRAFTETWLIGEGIEFNVYNAWIAGFTSSNTNLRYFENTAEEAIDNLIACTARTSFVLTRASTRILTIAIFLSSRRRGLWRKQ